MVGDDDESNELVLQVRPKVCIFTFRNGDFTGGPGKRAELFALLFALFDFGKKRYCCKDELFSKALIMVFHLVLHESAFAS